MERFIRGDIVVVNFPFTDLREAKRRPALVLKAVGDEDLILCQITSKVKQDSYSITLSVSDVLGGGLSQESYIRPNRLFTLHQDLIVKKAGQLKPEIRVRVIGEIISFLEQE
jgi:mRNA interferase MazF